ncbi:DUF2851 family protein [Daejeonella oryzae]|uniref:DUF2851 family protein n=1 Tax=Daejeonella oryzae TaxID=1122943 RepID=UPI0004184D95|nr:DUF2851 family protein [Daejeonella oryzae]
MPFPEEFLHYLWKFRLFEQGQLQTSSGESLQIFSPGIHNKDSGPDFENARIKIGEHTWAGNVEIHLKSSDWERHHHQSDKAYENVILHVVYQSDRQILRQDQSRIPELILEDLIPEGAWFRYQELMMSLNWIPCEKLISSLNFAHVDFWLSRMIVERMESKNGMIKQLLQEFNGSWDDAFYICIARNFGFKTNALPFELLARSISQQILARHKDNLFQIEALLFGQAGFLEEKFNDEYPALLKKEYQFLKAKYSLISGDKFIWKYLRLRPQNFPCIRIAQFAALISKSSFLFSKIIEITSVDELRWLFSDLKINDYWQNHYRFDQPSARSSKKLGEDSINNILINSVAVSTFAFSQQMGLQAYMNNALSLLEKIPGETNQVLNRFNLLGVKADTAFRSQALMHLKASYCDHKKCLHCGIGIKLLKQ